MIAILQIETSTTICSVALSVNGETIACKEANERNIHASKITLFIEEVMQEAGLKYSQLSAVAIAKGPGSYTGLRIGVSTAKGICFALDIPLLAIGTLEMMAEGFKTENPFNKDFIVPMLDARRMEVYTALYSHSGEEIEPVRAEVIDAHSFTALLESNKLNFIGDGSEKCSGVFVSENAVFNGNNFNSAKYLSKRAFYLYENGIFEDVAYFEPYYLKDFMVTQPKKRL